MGLPELRIDELSNHRGNADMQQTICDLQLISRMTVRLNRRATIFIAHPTRDAMRRKRVQEENGQVYQNSPGCRSRTRASNVRNELKPIVVSKLNRI